MRATLVMMLLLAACARHGPQAVPPPVKLTAPTPVAPIAVRRVPQRPLPQPPPLAPLDAAKNRLQDIVAAYVRGSGVSLEYASRLPCEVAHSAPAIVCATQDMRARLQDQVRKAGPLIAQAQLLLDQRDADPDSVQQAVAAAGVAVQALTELANPVAR
jgi:hypothetical protein